MGCPFAAGDQHRALGTSMAGILRRSGVGVQVKKGPRGVANAGGSLYRGKRCLSAIYSRQQNVIRPHQCAIATDRLFIQSQLPNESLTAIAISCSDPSDRTQFEVSSIVRRYMCWRES
jgi:hypothetical protein